VQRGVQLRESRRTRTNTPTEQLSLQSNYWKDWDFSARISYSAGEPTYSITTTRSLDAFRGRMFGTIPLRTGARPACRRFSRFGVTWRVTDQLSFLDSFHYSNWHDPAEFLASECSFFSASLLVPRTYSHRRHVAGCLRHTHRRSCGTPVHSASSGPDVGVLEVSRFLKLDEKTNLAELEYAFGRLGYRTAAAL